MKLTKIFSLLPLIGCLIAATDKVPVAQAADGKKPNIVVIMGDDVGIWNIGAYHRGVMAGRTPNIDQLAREGAIFTDYYAEASCAARDSGFIKTAGRREQTAVRSA